MIRLAGIDGCRAGWFVVTGSAGIGREDWFVACDFASAMNRLGEYDVIAIDIPIGLTDAGPRQCDLLARKLLQPYRGSSVFPAPVRSVLGSANYREACERRERADGKRISIQTFNITAKIDEVDRAVRARPPSGVPIYEVHPEVSFAALAGGAPMQFGKARLAGREERRAHLDGVFARNVLDSALAANPVSQVALDDVLDAFVALWTARRIHAGEAGRMPAEPEYDSKGLDMAIRF